MEHILTDFCSISDQSVNLHKSQILILNNIACNFKPIVFTTKGIACITNLGSYLSMPLIHGCTNKHTYRFIIDKVRTKLAAWKAKILSQAERGLLVKNVISLMKTYAMQTVQLPANLIDEIEKISRSFFLGETDQMAKLHWCPWKLVCQPVHNGGLGIKRLHDMNTVMLAKLEWQMLTHHDKLWINIILCKYGDLLQDRPRQNLAIY